ncbi:MAG TPA: hypothetical protein VH560_15385 [Polyangia bacterium]|jgi:hypothetical protein|nr:hypothetical protein [Polyangia bacterium]
MLRLRVMTFGVLLLALVPACKQPDSILLIEVSGPQDIMAVQFYVTMTADVAPVARSFYVPPEPMPSQNTIVLPASFTVALDSSYTGPIAISIEAVDATKSPLGSGTTMQQHIELGGQTIIPVALTDALPPGGVDAGTDAASDAGGLGTAGAGGGGQGGEGGQGGSDGGDASDTSSDGPGLDGATD